MQTGVRSGDARSVKTGEREKGGYLSLFQETKTFRSAEIIPRKPQEASCAPFPSRCLADSAGELLGLGMVSGAWGRIEAGVDVLFRREIGLEVSISISDCC